MLKSNLFSKKVIYHSSSVVSSLFKCSSAHCLPLNVHHKLFSTQFTKLITPVELRTRQKRLAENVFKSEGIGFSDYLILIPGAIRTFQTDTIIPNIHFKQNSDFIYFTGLNRIDSSECVLALTSNNGKIKEATLYSPTISEHQSVWEGDGVKSNYNHQHINNICDQIQDISKLYNLLSFTFKEKPVFATSYLQRYDQLRNLTLGNPKMNHLLSNYIDKLRLIKSKEEMNAMRRACRLGSDALRNTIEWSSKEPQANENQLACMFDYESRMQGAVKMSYPAVCAGNDRATIIHYGSNGENLQRGDWVLMDAGCEDLDGYCSDITRCWQIGGGLENSGLNSKLQFALYQALCELQKKLIGSIEVGHSSLNSLFVEMCDGLLVILKEFGIQNGLFNMGSSFNQVYPYCPHHVSHFLGKLISFLKNKI